MTASRSHRDAVIYTVELRFMNKGCANERQEPSPNAVDRILIYDFNRLSYI
jgi:hypothetical protein